VTGPGAQPHACGYFRLPGHLSDQCRQRETALLRAQFTERAARAGLCLSGVFYDAGRRHDHAFYALQSEVRHSHAVAVIVPDLAHLTRVSALAGADRLTLARYLRAAIVLLSPNDS